MQKRRRGGTLLVVIALLASCLAPESSGSIQLEKVGTVSGPVEDGGFAGATLLSGPLSDGRRIAITPWVAPQPPVFVVDRNGRVVDTLATIGQGPGQVEQPLLAFVGLGDTIFVLGIGHLHLFGPDLRYMRSLPSGFGGAWAGSQVADGTILLSSSSVGGRQEVVAALSPVDGSRRWSLLGPPFESGRRGENRFAAPAPDGTIWTVRAWDEYQLEQYSPDGRLLRTIKLEAPWFPPYLKQTDHSRNARPNTVLTGFWVDSAGRGWILGQAPDPDWAEAEGEVQRSEGQEIFVPKRYNDVRDGVIEVVDLEKGTRLATWQRDEIFGVVAEQGMTYQWRSNEDGWMQIDLFRVVPRF